MGIIADFQEENGLVADGIVGKKTALKIGESLGISNKFHLAHLLGQSHHESNGFKAVSENLNYSVDGLMKTFRTHFNDFSARNYAKKPEKIANLVYAGRMGNSTESSGDGWKYRGRGCIQLTGKNNYLAYFKWCGLPADTNPDLVAGLDHFFKVAKFFFEKNSVFEYCKSMSTFDITTVSKIINCGNRLTSKNPIGLDERIRLSVMYYNLISDG